ncbi:MAG: hypothetical protein ACQEW8_07240 [Actinomycetota bacterium]
MGVLVFLAFILTGAGIAVLVLRQRVAKNMAAANVVPARFGAVGYVVAIGTGQILLGLGSIVLAVVLGGRGDFETSARALDAVLQSAGLNTSMVAVVAVGTGGVAATVGVLLIRQVWQTRRTWADGASGVRLPPPANRRLVVGTLLVAYGAIACLFGAGLLVRHELHF